MFVLLRISLLLIVFLKSYILVAQSPGEVEFLGKEINSEYNEIGPVIAPDGKTLYFSRISHPQNTNGAKGSQDIWFSELKNNKWTPARRMPAVLNKEVYNAVYSITPDGNTLLLKGSFEKGVYQTRGFSISQRNARGWSPPQKLHIPGYEKMSKGEFDCGFLSNDGKVLILSFSEKKKSRADDLYVSFKEKEGTWSKPVNLGPEINTNDFTETTPFLAADGVTIYFSSDRPGGLGSNDIYYSKRIDKSWKRWSKPVNLGPAVNTDGFDAYYTVAAAGDYAYWTSFHKNSMGKGDVVRLELRVKRDDTEQKPETDTLQTIAEGNIPLPDPVIMLSGKVLDAKTGKPLEATIVFQSFPDGEEVGSASTNPGTGEYKFTLPYGKVYTMRPVSPDFIAESERIDLTDAGLDSTGTASRPRTFREIGGKTLKLVPIEVGQIVRLNNIFFETAKSELRPESRQELDQMVLTLRENPTMEVELGGHTDNIGSDATNLKLSQDRSDAVRQYLIGQGIGPERVVSKGYGKTRPVASNDTPEGQQANRRVEFTILKK